MNTTKLITDFGLEVFAEGKEREIKKFYIGDLLSWVMGNADGDCCWLTIMSNVNVAAVATLTDCSCVVLCEGVQPDPQLKQKMQKQGIYLLGTNLTMYEFVRKITETERECL
jgi:hypothetical protein